MHAIGEIHRHLTHFRTFLSNKDARYKKDSIAAYLRATRVMEL